MWEAIASVSIWTYKTPHRTIIKKIFFLARNFKHERLKYIFDKWKFPGQGATWVVRGENPGASKLYTLDSTGGSFCRAPLRPTLGVRGSECPEAWGRLRNSPRFHRGILYFVFGEDLLHAPHRTVPNKWYDPFWRKGIWPTHPPSGMFTILTETDSIDSSTAQLGFRSLESVFIFGTLTAIVGIVLQADWCF